MDVGYGARKTLVVASEVNSTFDGAALFGSTSTRLLVMARP